MDRHNSTFVRTERENEIYNAITENRERKIFYWYKADEVADLARRMLEMIKHTDFGLGYAKLHTDLEQIVKEGK